MKFRKKRVRWNDSIHIFVEAPALYGLIVGIILSSRVGQSTAN
ncbi:hypothetical protein OROMI_010003 [Orobanche minor]